jgi:hypothetical protein
MVLGAILELFDDAGCSVGVGDLHKNLHCLALQMGGEDGVAKYDQPATAVLETARDLADDLRRTTATPTRAAEIAMAGTCASSVLL